MQFTIHESVKEIKDAVKVFAASGDYGRKTLSILTVHASEDHVSLSAVSGTRISFNADVQRPGKCSISLDSFVDAVKTIEGAPSFEFSDDNDHNVTMTEADGFSRVIGSWSDNFVGDVIEKTDRAISLIIDGAAVSEAVKAVSYAASDDEPKYAMCGVNFNFSGIVPDGMDGGKVYAIATDGRRLAWSEAGEIPVGVSGIIPGDNFTVKSSVINFVADRASKTGSVTFSVSAEVEKAKYGDIVHRICCIDFGRFHIVGAGISNDFPDWKRVIPSASIMTSEFTLAPDFVKESDRIAKTVNNKYKKIIVKFDGEIMVLDSEVAKQTIKAATKINGFNLFNKFAINVNYIREAVKAAGKSVVRFQMVDKGRPILATVGDGASGSVIMPMNLDC